MSAGRPGLAEQLGTRRAARTMVLVYVAGGVTALLDVHLLRPGPELDAVMRQQVTVLATIELVGAAILWWLPWQRWPRSATLPLLLWAMVLHAAFGFVGFMSPAVSVAFLSAGFVWLGVFHTWRSVLVATPAAAAIYVGPLWVTTGSPEYLGTLLIIVPVWLLIGYVASRTVTEVQDTHEHLQQRAQLMEAVARAGRATSRLRPPEVIAALLDAVRGVGATHGALVLDADDGTTSAWLLATADDRQQDAAQTLGGSAAPRALRAEDAQRLTAAIEDPASPGAVALTTAVQFDNLHLPAGTWLSAAPLPTLGAQGMLFGVHRPDHPPHRAQLQALQLLANHGGQALSTATLFQIERREHRRHAADARRDGLTGIGNRRAIDAAIDALRIGDVVVLLDLDHFKSVNDTHGHLVGDDTLRRFARYLEGVTRAQDELGRYGGEEFLLILARAEPEADAAVERVLAGWRATDPVTTVSAGYACHQPGATPVDTLHAADAALYEAKQQGRDRSERAACGPGSHQVLHAARPVPG